jgi:hypothetical protein
MDYLKSEFFIERKDIEIKEKKILLRYSNILKKHKKLDLRLRKDNNNNELNDFKNALLSINYNSLKKILNFLDNEIFPEEFVLFLFEKSNKNENEINTEKETEQEENDEKKKFLTLEIENPPILKKYRTLTYQIMKKYYFIFCIISFLIALLFTLHLFSYLVTKDMKICKYIFTCISVIGLYILLGYSYYTKSKNDKPSYNTVRNIQILCFCITIINYIFIINGRLSPNELIKYYDNNKAGIVFIHILSLLSSLGILSFYWMIKKKRGNFSQYDEILIQ